MLMPIAVVVLSGAQAEAQKPQQQQQSPIAGVWMARVQAPGVQQATMIWAFRADGQCLQSIVLPNGQMDYYCQYQPSQNGVTVVYQSWSPQNLQPGVPMNQPINLNIRFQGPNLFFMEDSGGPVRFVRQQQ
jgi:hypothetical protein